MVTVREERWDGLTRERTVSEEAAVRFDGKRVEEKQGKPMWRPGGRTGPAGAKGTVCSVETRWRGGGSRLEARGVDSPGLCSLVQPSALSVEQHNWRRLTASRAGSGHTVEAAGEFWPSSCAGSSRAAENRGGVVCVTRGTEAAVPEHLTFRAGAGRAGAHRGLETGASVSQSWRLRCDVRWAPLAAIHSEAGRFSPAFRKNSFV